MSDIEDAIALLAKAGGVKELIDAHQKARRAVLAGRRHAKRTEGGLGAVFAEAMRLSDQQKAEGVPRVERQATVERALRAAWPTTRAWKYLCEACSDYGLQMVQCPGDATCGRHKAHLPHEFGKPCWCSKGDKFKDVPKPTGDDFKAAGASKPQRLGRWNG